MKIKNTLLALLMLMGVSPLVAMKRSPVDQLREDSKKPCRLVDWATFNMLCTQNNVARALELYLPSMTEDDYRTLALKGLLMGNNEIINAAYRSGPAVLQAVLRGDARALKTLFEQNRIADYKKADYLFMAIRLAHKDLAAEIIRFMTPLDLDCGYGDKDWIYWTLNFSDAKDAVCFPLLVGAGCEIEIPDIIDNMRVFDEVLFKAVLDAISPFNATIGNMLLQRIIESAIIDHNKKTVCVSLLLEKNFEIRTSTIKSVLKLKSRMKDGAVVFDEHMKFLAKLLCESAGCNFEQLCASVLFEDAIVAGDEKNVIKSVEAGANVDVPAFGSGGYHTASVFSALRGRDSLVLYLLSEGASWWEAANILERNYNWFTPQVKNIIDIRNYIMGETYIRINFNTQDADVVACLEQDYALKRAYWFKYLVRNAPEDVVNRFVMYAPCQWLNPEVPKSILSKDKNHNNVIKVVSDTEWLEHELKKNAQRGPNKEAQKLYTSFVMGERLKQRLSQHNYTDLVIETQW